MGLLLALDVPQGGAQQGLLARSQVLNSAPSAGSQATVSAPAAPDKWVFDQVCFSAADTAAATGGLLSVNIRDGATGAGTVLTSFVLFIPTTAGVQAVVPLCTSLGFVGSANTAATAEFSAGMTNLTETVTFYFHKAQ